MSVWTRLFGPFQSSRPASKARMGLESLEAREVPAIVFVGGWGASSYQYAAGDTHDAAAVPTDQFSVNYAKVRFDAAPAGADTTVLRADSGAGEGRSAAADDVWVDGRVITGENYDSATIASSGYIKVKKLNSG